jgi:hypothetical protein
MRPAAGRLLAGRRQRDGRDPGGQVRRWDVVAVGVHDIGLGGQAEQAVVEPAVRLGKEITQDSQTQYSL